MITRLYSLKAPSKYLAEPNEQEELYIEGWKIVESEVDRLSELGYRYEKKGQADKANLAYQGANYYFYLIFYGMVIRNSLKSRGLLNKKCNSLQVAEDFKLDCVEEKLNCLSKKYGANYIKAWDKLLAVYGIDRQTTNCDDCCLGLGELTIGEDDDCSAFVLGPCDILEDPLPPFGEFKLCEFRISEVSQSFGEDLYNNC
jgi:hypothetical protein